MKLFHIVFLVTIFSIEVNAQSIGSNSPTISIDKPLMFTEDDTLRIDLNTQVTDDETAGRDIKWHVIPPSELDYEIARNNELILWALPNWHGQTEIVLKATDLQNLSTEATVEVTVTPVHDISLGNIILPRQGELTVNLRGHIVTTATQDLENIKWDWRSAGDISIVRDSVDAHIIYIRPNPNFRGVAEVMFTATDTLSNESAMDTAFFARDASILPPTSSPISPAGSFGLGRPKFILDSLPAFFEDDTLRVDLTIMTQDDETPGSKMEWSVSPGASLHYRIDPNKRLVLWADPDWHGTSDILLKATDTHGQSSSQVFRLIVKSAHDISMGNIALPTLDDLRLDLKGYIVLATPQSSHADIVWLWDPIDPGELNIVSVGSDAAMLRIQPGPTFEDTVSVRFTATDTVNNISDSAIAFFYRTSFVFPRQTAPVIMLPEELVFAEDETLRIDLKNQVRDNHTSGSSMNWELESSAAWLHAQIFSNNELLIWAQADSSGEATVSVKAIDEHLETDTLTVDVRITPVHDIEFESFDLAKNSEISIDLGGRISLPNDSDILEHIDWSWSFVSEDILRLRLSDFRTLVLEAGPAFPDTGSVGFWITATHAISGEKDSEFIDIIAQRGPPRLVVADTLFVRQKRELRIEKITLVEDDGDAANQVQLDVDIINAQPFNVRIEQDMADGREFLVLDSNSDISGTGVFDLIARNSAGLADTARVFVVVDPGPILDFPAFIEIPWDGTSKLILDGYVNSRGRGSRRQWSFQSGIKVGLQLLSGEVQRSDDSLRTTHVDTILSSFDETMEPVAVSWSPGKFSFGNGESDTLQITAKGSFFVGEEQVIVSVRDSATNLVYTASFAVKVALPVNGPPFFDNPSFTKMEISTSTVSPKGSVQWIQRDPIGDVQAEYVVYYSADPHFLNRTIVPVPAQNNTSSTFPGELLIGRSYWARVLVSYPNLHCFWSEPLRVKPDQPPGSPILDLPLAEARLLPHELHFSIRRPIDPDGDPVVTKIEFLPEIPLSPADTAVTVAFPEDALGQTVSLTLGPRQLRPGRKYTWRAISSSGGLTTFSDKRLFTLYRVSDDQNINVLFPQERSDGSRFIEPFQSFVWSLNSPDGVRIAPDYQLEFVIPASSDTVKVDTIDANIHFALPEELADKVFDSESISFYRLSVYYSAERESGVDYVFDTTHFVPFQVVKPPVAPVLLGPATQDTILSQRQIKFSWQSPNQTTEFPVTYVVQVARHFAHFENEGETILEQDAGALLEYLWNADDLIAALPSQGEPYFWRVIASNGFVEAKSKSVRMLFVYDQSNITDLLVELETPEKDELLDLTDEAFRLSWKPAVHSNPVYLVKIDEDSVLAGIFEESMQTSAKFTLQSSLNTSRLFTVRDTFFNPDQHPELNLGYDKTYYWAVQSRDIDGLRVTKTASRRFNTAHRPQPFRLLLPDPDTVVREKSLLFKWERSVVRDSAESEVEYFLDFSTTPNFEPDNVLSTKQAKSDTSFLLTEDFLTNLQVAYWRVRAVSSNTLVRQGGELNMPEPRRLRKNAFELISPSPNQPNVLMTRNPTLRWVPYYESIDRLAAEYIVELKPNSGSLVTVSVDTDSLAVGSNQYPELLLREMVYMWRVGKPTEEGVVWAQPGFAPFFTGDRKIRNFYSFPNPFNPISGEVAQFHAEFVEPINRASVRILTAHPPHIPIFEKHELRLDSSRKSLDSNRPAWDGIDIMGRSMGYGIYIAELKVEYEDESIERAYYSIAIGTRHK